MDRVLRQLHTETFVLNSRNPVASAPQVAGYGIVRVDDHTLEIEVSKDRNLNDVFAALSAADIEIVSMRNKVNRLEEVFMRLTDKSGAARAAQP
jgi:ABC-2 type transport system ATP-binding protein